jgi:hypothetical protein
MSSQKLSDDDKRCIRNDINYSKNCDQNTDGKCEYNYEINGLKNTGYFNCKENDFFNITGEKIIFQCPSRTRSYIDNRPVYGDCTYTKIQKPVTPKAVTGSHFSTNFPTYIIIGVIAAIVIFLILFFTLKSNKSNKSGKSKK